MNKSPLIGIIIPVYNVENYIKRCINSVVSQTYHNLEIILVDDGSTDASGKICEQYAKRDKRIKVIHKKNGGLSEARNVGIQAVSTDYIVFIDADDYVCSLYIQRLVQILFKYSTDIVICGYEQGTKEKFTGKMNDHEKIYLYSSEEMLKNWHGKYKHIETMAWNKLYKKSLFTENDIYFPVGYNNYEDVQTTHLVISKAQNVAITNECLYYYYQRKGSIMNTISENSIRNCINAQNTRLDFFRSGGYLKAYERLAIKRQKQYMLIYTQTIKKEKLKNINKKMIRMYLNDYPEVYHFRLTKIWERILFGAFKYLCKFV